MINSDNITKEYGWGIKVASLGLLLLLLFILLEVGGHLFYALRKKIISPTIELHEYQRPDPDHPGNYLLKPGFSETLGQAIRIKKEKGQVLGLHYLLERAPLFHASENTVLFRIDSDGYIGPEIDKAHAKARILTIGDSCTFGSPFNSYSYPRTLEQELKKAGLEVEVVNAGVEGYAPSNVLFRIEEFKRLRPEITTVYLGWNALYDANRVRLGMDRYLTSLRLVKKAYERLQLLRGGSQRLALAEYNKPKHPDPHDPLLRDLDGYSPDFMPEMERIVREMQTVGSRIILLTLPGLYDLNKPISALALKKGHLPSYTDNPYVLAKIAAQYNIALRRLGRRLSIPVIDLEKWGKTELQPKDQYFYDSVHLYEEGQAKIGRFLSRKLSPRLQAAEKVKP